MTSTIQPATANQTGTNAALSTVQSFFRAMAERDMETVAHIFGEEATWNHRNQDRFEGIHRGRDAILDFIRESVQLTSGTLRPIPQAFMPDGDGRVAVLVRLAASRPDGRSADDDQMVLFTTEDDRIKAVDHFVGDPAAVTAFWA